MNYIIVPCQKKKKKEHTKIRCDYESVFHVIDESTITSKWSEILNEDRKLSIFQK